MVNMIMDTGNGGGKGIDNLAATEDDGSILRPDLVISVQPHAQVNRAELPVSTLDWRSNHRGQFIPTHGLDFLIGVSSLLIQQTVELDDLTSKIDSENRYIVRVPNGEALYIASETSSSSQRCLCGSGRAFVMHLHDNTRQEAMVLQRRLAGSSCFFPCRLQEMKVITPPGDYVGRVQQRCTWVVPVFLVRDANEQVLFIIEGPAVLQRSALMLSEFKIMTGDSLREVGRIAHGWDRELVSFVTTLQIPDAAVQPKHKCLLLAASFLLSLKWYTGRFLRDTMHGEGEFRWRYKGEHSAFITYEGHFYENQLHGYGVRSFPDGRVFSGLFHKNMRWGPGVETEVSLQENVGLWRTRQLLRLAWQPQAPNVTLDLNSKPAERALVEPHRAMFTTRVKTIGEVNSAIELLKQCGADPILASQKWSKLYPKHCTDLSSPACHVDLFDNEYYGAKIVELEKIEPETSEELDQNGDDAVQLNETFYSWNNTESMMKMMQYCFKHEEQRIESGIDLKTILNGPRSQYKPAAQHELDCRTLLMACYLGQIKNVAQLVNEDSVNPNVADMLGNTALMYATCGDQAQIMQFLIEAGANVNSYNDSCLSPLGVALVRFACASKGIAPCAIVQALVPTTQPTSDNLQPKPSDWHISRDLLAPYTNDQLTRTVSKTGTKPNVSKRKASQTADEGLTGKRKAYAVTAVTSSSSPNRLSDVFEEDTDKACSEEKQLYRSIYTEYLIKLTDLLSPNDMNQIPYLFEVTDMAKDVNTYALEQMKLTTTEKVDKSSKKNVPKVVKDRSKMISHDNLMSKEYDNEKSSINSADQRKIHMLNENMATIVQLLKDGADPKLVRCPQPALWIAIVSGSTDLVRLLVKYGADINETYPDALNYSALDIAVSQPLSNDNVELVRAILECGAETGYRLKFGNSETSASTLPEKAGPTLLHAVLAKKTDSDDAEEIRQQLIKLLLQYNCNSLTQYEGVSAIDLAMTKNMNLLQTFVLSPKTDLNAPVNSRNQTILVKMFSLQFQQEMPLNERLALLTDLMLYGADPLLECKDGDDSYANIFVFAKKNLLELSGGNKPDIRNTSPSGTQTEAKPKKGASKSDKQKKEDKTKPMPKALPQLGDYKQALALVTDCARMLHIRWIQAKILKELLKVIAKYEHRQWNMILPEYKNKKACGFWLTYPRSLEIWDILQSARKKKLVDRRILKHLLCIVHYFNNRVKKTFKWPLTAEEKGQIETEVFRYLREHKTSPNLADEIIPYARPYVTPELFVGAEAKFNVCFECVLPLEEQKILCLFCKQVSFCSFECMKMNIDRVSCHPCSNYLQNKYFPTPEDTGTQTTSV